MRPKRRAAPWLGMRYFLDTEFIDHDAGTDLISLGLVTATGAEFYAISADYDREAAEAYPWLAEHVLPHLDAPDAPKPQPIEVIAAEVTAFCATHDDGRKPEAWAWNGAYDFYLFTRLFGRRHRIPTAVPSSFYDLKQWARTLGNVTVPAQVSDEHHALADAHHDRMAFGWLAEYEEARMARREERIRRRLVEAATSTLRTTPLR